MAEINRHDARLMAARHETSSHGRSPRNDPLMNKDNQTFSVFLTGASGFIGTQILRQLLGLRHVKWVTSLVRGEVDEAARYRTIDTAVTALCYEVLEAASVGSTVELLLLASRLPYMIFLYITGGRPRSSLEEPDVMKKLSVADAIPYSQTKLVAEAVARRAAQSNLSETGRLAVLNPGWVTGTPDEGVSNTGDYIWRLVATCIKIGAYNTRDADGWLFVSDVTTTAAAIIDAALGKNVEKNATKCPADRITWRDIWSILESLGYRLQGKSTAEWLALVRADMGVEKETHPLWPLAHMIEGFQNDRRMAKFSLGMRVCTPLRLKRAVAKSAEYPVRVGFLPSSPGVR
ncbi:uncharacterized protein BDW47DRAFT_122408 [Aspergillus candidus]|uniref:Thioester reductase (TE) domain-containing protein n=1 Tax=Aspergillus candidus TaxID=41067 RepID=A0A2I2FMW0_ASPCN|nr:hypothetical protein BDW47DRAFT_122408 [Aspergillus candidus]PLB41966.1 hypothetical protein BDW47DRAFT_122408 [Aspergillus candidus]